MAAYRFDKGGAAYEYVKHDQSCGCTDQRLQSSRVEVGAPYREPPEVRGLLGVVGLKHMRCRARNGGRETQGEEREDGERGPRIACTRHCSLVRFLFFSRPNIDFED